MMEITHVILLARRLPDSATPQLYAASCIWKTGAITPLESNLDEESLYGNLLRAIYCMASLHQEVSMVFRSNSRAPSMGPHHLA